MRYDNIREDIAKLLVDKLGYTEVDKDMGGGRVFCKMMNSIPVAIKLCFNEKLFEIYNIQIFWDVGHEEWLRDLNVVMSVSEFGNIFVHARELVEIDLITLYNHGAGLHVHDREKFPGGAVKEKSARTGVGAGSRRKKADAGSGTGSEVAIKDFKKAGDLLSWQEQAEYGDYVSKAGNEMADNKNR